MQMNRCPVMWENGADCCELEHRALQLTHDLRSHFISL